VGLQQMADAFQLRFILFGRRGVSGFLGQFQILLALGDYAREVLLPWPLVQPAVTFSPAGLPPSDSVHLHGILVSGWVARPSIGHSLTFWKHVDMERRPPCVGSAD